MFSAEGQLVFYKQELNFFIRKTFLLMVKPDKIIFRSSQFAHCLALDETSASLFVFLFLAKTVYSNKTNLLTYCIQKLCEQELPFCLHHICQAQT